MGCAATDDDFEWFEEQYCGIYPCSEYGDCEFCPYYGIVEE